MGREIARVFRRPSSLFNGDIALWLLRLESGVNGLVWPLVSGLSHFSRCGCWVWPMCLAWDRVISDQKVKSLEGSNR